MINVKLSRFFFITPKQDISPTPAGINKNARCSNSKSLTFSIISNLTIPIQSAVRSNSRPKTLLGIESLKINFTNSPKMQKKKIIAICLKYFKSFTSFLYLIIIYSKKK